MIEEAYVSFDTAKLLKEKGFDEECFRFYMPTGNGRWKYEHYHDFDISDRIECPTQQMAMRWLRRNIILSSQLLLKEISIALLLGNFGIQNGYIQKQCYLSIILMKKPLKQH